ncbi:MAG: MraY family glycosyltransferase, partial [Vicingaceae bacterium]
IMTLMADIRITSLYGIFEIREIPEWASIALTVFTYVVVINAFNLIDGVDGLAGGVGCIASVSFGIWFLLAGSMVDAIIAFALAGALLGFLRFNFYPANIFMGDSGSLTVGLIVCVLAIQVIEFDFSRVPEEMKHISKPIFAMAVLSYPLIDTFRVFTIRIAKGLSPFIADSNHIHHRLLNLGLNQAQTVGIIYLFNTVLIAYAVIIPLMNTSITFLIMSAIVFAFLGALFLIPAKSKSK